MNIELTEGQIRSILDKAKSTVEKEALALLRAAVQKDLSMWVNEVKNAAKTSIANDVAQKVIQKLDVNASIEKAMDNVNQRIHRDLTKRLAGGIEVTFKATVSNPVVSE